MVAKFRKAGAILLGKTNMPAAGRATPPDLEPVGSVAYPGGLKWRLSGGVGFGNVYGRKRH